MKVKLLKEPCRCTVVTKCVGAGRLLACGVLPAITLPTCDAFFTATVSLVCSLHHEPAAAGQHGGPGLGRDPRQPGRHLTAARRHAQRHFRLLPGMSRAVTCTQPERRGQSCGTWGLCALPCLAMPLPTPCTALPLPHPLLPSSRRTLWPTSFTSRGRTRPWSSSSPTSWPSAPPSAWAGGCSASRRHPLSNVGAGGPVMDARGQLQGCPAWKTNGWNSLPRVHCCTSSSPSVVRPARQELPSARVGARLAAGHLQVHLPFPGASNSASCKLVTV